MKEFNKNDPAIIMDKIFDENDPGYLINYTEGNGYRCSCCRNEWNDTASFDTKEEMLKWIARKDKPTEDIDVDEILQVLDNEKYRRLYELTEEDKEQIKKLKKQIKKLKK